MWDLIVSVPVHCLSFYFSKFNVGLKPLSHQGLSKPEFYGDFK